MVTEGASDRTSAFLNATSVGKVQVEMDLVNSDTI